MNELALPGRDNSVKIAVRALRYEKDYTLYSPMSDIAVIERADLLEDQLFLEYEKIGERQYVLNWKESQGEWYEIQQWSQGDNCWITKKVLNRTDSMNYMTGHLPSYRQVRFRVISYNELGEREQEEFETEPSEVIFHTDMSSLYCTIWPIAPLKIVDTPQTRKILGEVPAGQALCVLEETGSYFKILYKDCLGYVDSRFCMINLPEYMGDLCEYNISNSIGSIFTVHGYNIPQITGSVVRGVVRGYENICIGREDYVVPYLYPCTEKFCLAAANAAKDGYCFRTYDAFRPNEATRYLYDTVETLIDNPIESENINPLDDELEEAHITFRDVMTDGYYKLSSFLAASVSAHNRGIALDLVLVDRNTDKELQMQSDMHDLSCHSLTSQNNNNAQLLAKYMKGVGYNDLFSEWWHFQDDETREEIGLNAYLRKSVSIEGWKKDDIGWRYCLKNGSFYIDTIVIIDDKKFTFDVDGYCKELNFE